MDLPAKRMDPYDRPTAITPWQNSIRAELCIMLPAHLNTVTPVIFALAKQNTQWDSSCSQTEVWESEDFNAHRESGESGLSVWCTKDKYLFIIIMLLAIPVLLVVD